MSRARRYRGWPAAARPDRSAPAPAGNADGALRLELVDAVAAAQELVIADVVSENGVLVFVGDDRQAIYGFAGADASSFEAIKAFRENNHDLNLPDENKALLSHLSVMLGVPMPTIYELMAKSRYLLSVSVDVPTFD